MIRVRHRLLLNLGTRCFLTGILFFLLAGEVFGAERYRLRFSFSGQAQGKILLIFTFRFSYEASAELDLTAEPDGRGGLSFQFAGIPSPGYVMRTLGFSGKAFVIVTAHDRYEVGEAFGKERVARWLEENTRYSKFFRKIKYLSFMVDNRVPEAFVFHRDAGGLVTQSRSLLKLQYKHHPQEIGIYFRVYVLFAEMLRLFNHSVWPGDAVALPLHLPEKWAKGPFDLGPALKQVGEQTEEIVASAVKFNQDHPFSMDYRLIGRDDQITELAGLNRENPKIWRSFRILRCERLLKISTRDALPLRDELHLVIGNGKGQGGGGYLLLERIESGL